MRKSCISTLTGLCLAAGCSLTANAQIITEGFDDINTLVGAGWVRTNNSTPVGTTAWFQGNSAVFPAQAGAPTAYIGANFNNTAGTGTISNWLLTPAVNLQNNMQLKFWTRKNAGSTYPDRLQVRMSLAGASSNVGAGATGIGDFTTLLLDINPTYQNGAAGYPEAWTEFTINLTGIGAPTQGRLAFRYFVENAGPTGTNSDYIGIDTVTLSGPVDPCTQPLPPCPADVAPVGGNDVVNVDDLLAVINTWGQTQNPPGTGPRPQGDCAPLPNGNCLVNVDDLLAVINAWGNCPVPTGACCAVDGSCTVQTEANCTAGGGNYEGDGVSCATVTCPVLPANDNCGGAIAVFNGQTNIDNSLATNGTAPGGTCIFGGPGNFSGDLWYSYTATCTGRLTVDLCATGGTVTDTVLQMFTGTCGSLVEFACDDDGCSPSTLTSTIFEVNVTAGQQFFIRAGTWAASPKGPMVLTIGCVVPSDDNCGDASPLTVPGSVNGALNNATQDSAPVCNSVAAGVGRWYTVVGNGTTYTANTCGGPAQLWDGAISVYCGASCDGLFCVTAANADSCNFLQESVSWCAVAGQTYWILVHSPSAPGDGNYTLAVSSNGVACTSTVVCGATNDECAGATTANLGPNPGDNTLATTSAGIPGGACAFGGAANFTRDVWFKHTPAATGSLTVDICNNPGTVTDSVISVFTGTCGALTEIGCDDDTCATPALASSVTVPVTAGQQVFIRVGSWSTSVAGTFTLNLSVPPPPCSITCPGGAVPEGEPCLTAPPDSVNGGCNSTPTVYGSITPNGPIICGSMSTYLNGATQTRDTDWYRFTVAVAGTFRIEINAEIPALVGLVTSTNGMPVGSPCTGAAFVAGSTLVTTAAQNCTAVTSPAVNLNPGTYAVFVGPPVFTGFPCGGANDYQVRLLSP